MATPYNFFEPEDKHKWEEQASRRRRTRGPMDLQSTLQKKSKIYRSRSRSRRRSRARIWIRSRSRSRRKQLTGMR